MANTTTGLFETLVAAGGEATAHLQLSTLMLDRIYFGQEPIAGHHFGRTISIQVPTKDVSNVEDIQGNGPHFLDVDHTNYELIVNKHPSRSFVIREWDQTLTPKKLGEFYLAPAVSEVVEYINNDVCSLVTSTNFASYASITGGADTFEIEDLRNGWANLHAAGVPMAPGSFFFTTHSIPYSMMALDSNFRQEQIVGVSAAEAVQQRVIFAPQFGAILGADPQFPVASGAYAGLMHTKYAISARFVLPPPKMQGSGIMRTVVYPKGPNLPVIIDAWEDGDVGGHKFHVHAMYGKKVTRPEHASYMVTT